MTNVILYVAAGSAAVYLGYLLFERLQLSLAKHRSLRGHARMARRVARILPFYEYDETRFFRSDDPPADIEAKRRAGFARLASLFATRAPKTLAASAELEGAVSDVEFTNSYRVPFQFRNHVKSHLKLGLVLEATRGTSVCDLDGNWSRDLTGAYGTNLFGYDFYKGCIERGVERVRSLGPVLGPYHPIVADNARRLREISGMDEVSFHMSGTEAVMQAVRLARYHTGRSHIVRFCGAYHGWWDGVQAGVGNPRPAREVYTLEDLSPQTLRVLRRRRNIACVLVNPLQAMHANSNAPADSTLVSSDRAARFDRERYTAWLKELRQVCTERGIVLILDDVFLGFRLARGGSQEYFGIRADLVTYGKTLGGGLPIGVVCGSHELMRRFRPDRPADICFARGTFNSHPYVMATTNEFLRHLDEPGVVAAYAEVDRTWDARADALNRRLETAGVPVRVANMGSIWTTLYVAPSRYHWMFQYYLRAQGLTMSWVGTGRFIFSHDYTEQDYQEVADRFVAAAAAMQADGWWWFPPGLTAKWIKRRVAGEIVRTLLGRKPVPSVDAEPAGSPVVQAS
ncbi:MAG: aminotransferase class III-fold pyridoxal phosphate-dependent enzyme [Planctomycetes bacterium]|nr:aminotransferase class III-fold pyridoxal phosphate-dependent enzyme [Planctomycetota bacterium]MCB9869385.1 aminotransferase class III-fold pyridoxal phosphate-dependent enzyme [Planctomycetota bacterium]MCB9888558.1 aminotransferase class III-fold pyridoxal phosphate-dependent enzyme [Planctomycetota bacterium]